MFRIRQSTALRFGISALSLAASLLVVEAVLRRCWLVPDPIAPYYPGHATPGAIITAVQREFTVEMLYNNQGFRDRDFRIPKKRDETRILFLGDSFVAGQGVSEAQRASSVLQNAMNEMGDGNRYRSLNAGQIATGPLWYFWNLVRFGIALKPDILIIGIFAGNDFMQARQWPAPKTYTVNDTLPDLPLQPHPFLTLGYLRLLVEQKSSEQTRLVRRTETDRFWDAYYGETIDASWYKKKTVLSPDEYDIQIARLDPELVRDFFDARINPSYLLGALASHRGHTEADNYYSAADVAAVISLVSEMCKIAASRGARTLVVVYPDIHQVAPDSYLRLLTETLHYPELPHRLRELAHIRQLFVKSLNDNDLDFLDLTDMLTEEHYHLIDGHLNSAGHQVAASAILNYLMNKPTAPLARNN